MVLRYMNEGISTNESNRDERDRVLIALAVLTYTKKHIFNGNMIYIALF